MLKVKRNFGWTDIDMSVIELGKLLKHYTQCLKSEGKSPKTISWYGEMLCVFIRYLESSGISPVLANFNLVNVRDFVVYEQNRELSPYTVQARVRALKAFSSWLFSEQYTEENILANLKMPKAPVRMVEPLTPDEISTLITAQNSLTAIGSRNVAVLITFLGTGIRESELSNLHFEDAHIEQGYLKVMGKGSKERVVPIGGLGQKVLWRYVFHFRPEPINDTNNYLFLTLDGKKLESNAIKLFLKRWGKKAGVPRLHAHLCRHTYATDFLIYNCGDVFRLQQILGHTTLEMVRKYVHYASAHTLIQGNVTSPIDRMNIKGLRGYKIDRELRNNGWAPR
jgi:integrase/recombinase XerC/integrase/recombinase XerD